MTFRLDKILTLYFFHPLVKRFAPNNRVRGARIPILMYHSISNDPESTVHPYFRINTPPGLFAEHMKILHDKGYKIISLSAAVELIKQGGKCPSSFALFPMQPKAVLTFDDGYKDFLTQAFPILNRYKFAATVFLPTSFIDNEGKAGLKGRHHLSWDEVRELGKAGTVFGSHTVTHRQLSNLSEAEIEYEIRHSKEVIEDNLGQNIASFCFPYKFMDQDRKFVRIMKSMLVSTGYKNAVTTRIGTVSTEDDIFMLKRIPVNSDDEAEFLRGKLEGAYDWLHSFQYWSKKFKIRKSALFIKNGNPEMVQK